MNKNFSIIGGIVITTVLVSGCSEKILNAKGNPEQFEVMADSDNKVSNPTDQKQNNVEQTEETEQSLTDENTQERSASPESIQVVFNPESIPVLVNKQNKLPDNYHPTDLIFTEVPFVSGVINEKRKMRRVAAEAVNLMFAGAKAEGISLLGVSAYRSHATQTTLFNHYVNTDGYEKARTYSALPGTSEHETGLAIDVTGGNGKCAAENCFGGTKEAAWLEQHAAEYGFIIRYPQGKESITGYQYEPWHLRYVGKEIALEIMGKGITLEEYYSEV